MTAAPHAQATRRWPWLLAASTIAVFVWANVTYPDDDSQLLFTLTLLAIVAPFVVVGALLTVRVPGNVIGPLLLWSGAAFAATTALGTLSVIAAWEGGVPVQIVSLMALVNDVGFVVSIVIVLVGIPLVFPDGHLLSPRWRWIVVLAVVALAANTVSRVLSPEPFGVAEIPNTFAIPSLAPVSEALDTFSSWTSIIGFAAPVLAVLIRYRRGDEVHRHQLKWLIAVGVVAALAFPTAFLVPYQPVADLAFFIGLLTLIALPLAIGIAILRYRLYDIDRIISRTIGWTIVSGLLVAAFALLVVGLQELLTGLTQGETLAVAASTLVAFALFQPVRRTVQRAVDRRFDRARYDAQLTADAFAERLRDEVDLDTLAAELERTVSGAIRPTAASLWLPGREH